MSLPPVPSLDAIAANSRLVDELPAHVCGALAAKAAGVMAALGARLAVSASRHTPSQEGKTMVHDRLLTTEEAAVRLGTTPRWLRRHANRVPFTRRLSRKCIRFSEAGLTRWLATRRDSQ